ncbi:MAG: 5-(carboxyamino)imidazole ribonucleotide mutase [Syntrophobacteraceae bacterium]|nr:5-(carboxyamino)imidazole ribonucleotide mutase [Syntrophobacteraceae bacterium]
MNETPKVGILMGSDSDLPVMEEVFRVLDDFGIPYEARILSAHRSPEESADYARQAADRGLKVIIAGAGWAAHLAGVIAAATVLPVIGVPIDSSPLQGMDSLLSTVQMPPGIPVATMAIGRGGATNAAVFAVQILATHDAGLAAKLQDFKKQMAEDVTVKKRKKLEEYLSNRERG